MNRIPTIVTALALVALSLTSCQGRDTRNDRIATAWIAAWNSHDVERIVPVFTEDVLYEDVAFGLVNHGSAELRKFAAGFLDAVPDLKLELVHSAIGRENGTIEWVLSGTDKGVFKTGKPFSVRGASVLDVRDGRISRNLDYYDSAGLMRQVGLLPVEQPAAAN